MSWKSKVTVTGPVPGSLGCACLLYPLNNSLCSRVSFTSSAPFTNKEKVFDNPRTFKIKLFENQLGSWWNPNWVNYLDTIKVAEKMIRWQKITYICSGTLKSSVLRTIKITQKKLRDSDWLRAVQCNTSVKSVTTVQIAHRNSGLWLTERQWEIL